MGVNEKSILDLLARELNCYVSDLRNISSSGRGNKKRICKIIEQVPATAFSLHEWVSTTEYLMGVKKELNDQEEAKKYLTKTLSS